MSSTSSKSVIIKQEWSDTKFLFPISWAEQVAEIWPSMTKLNWVVKSIKCTQNKQKWFTQSQKKKHLNHVISGAFYRNWANHSGKLCNANGIKTMNHIVILSRSEEETPKLNATNTIQGDFCWNWANQIQY